MNRVFKTIAAPLEHAVLLNAVAAALGPATLSFAWTAGAGPASAAATHQITSGMVSEEFAAALASPQELQAAVAPVTALSLEEAQAALMAIDVSIEEAPLVLARLGLQLERPDGESLQ